jgi:hypothetical protein
MRGPQQWDRVGASRLYVYIGNKSALRTITFLVNNSVYEYLTGNTLPASPVKREVVNVIFLFNRQDFAKYKVPWLDSYEGKKKSNGRVVTSAPPPEDEDLETMELPSESKFTPRRFGGMLVGMYTLIEQEKPLQGEPVVNLL